MRRQIFPCLEILVVSLLSLLNKSFLVLLLFLSQILFTEAAGCRHMRTKFLTGWLCMRNVQDQLTRTAALIYRVGQSETTVHVLHVLLQSGHVCILCRLVLTQTRANTRKHSNVQRAEVRGAAPLHRPVRPVSKSGHTGHRRRDR